MRVKEEIKDNGKVGVVIIGRNEGARLTRCFNSIPMPPSSIIYVDSNSRDSSVYEAKRLGIETLELSVHTPTTAGRARQEGFRRFLSRTQAPDYIQFIDGDCELAGDWLEAAISFLEEHPSIDLVCGARTERFPNASLYNLACDVEWDTPIGPTTACGGDFLIRSVALQEVGGFNTRLIAGEEPELCHRLVKQGRMIQRLERKMTTHDARLVSFSQWSTRAIRSGFAYAAVAHLHFCDQTHFWWKENCRIAAWAFGLPALTIILSFIVTPWALMLAGIYPMQVIRLGERHKRQKRRYPYRLAALNVIGKWYEFWGQCRFAAQRIAGNTQQIIEYK